MKRSGTLILLALPAALVLIAWPVSHHRFYFRGSSKSTSAFAGAVETTSVALFRGNFLLSLRRAGPELPPIAESEWPDSNVVADRQFSGAGLSLRVEDEIARDWAFTAWTPTSPVKTHREISVRLSLPIVALILSIPLAAVLIRGHSRYRRWRKAGRCGECGYDLTGNVTGLCSECGTTFDSTKPEEER